MNKHGLTRENLLATFPMALAKDPSVLALAEIAADLLVQRLNEIEQINLYAQIDRLEEPLLDILANDFKVDWWNPDYTVKEKRQTLKDSWKVHRMLGTKAAVLMALSAIYPKVDLKEWFEYDGEPYHFKLLIDLTDELLSAGKPGQVIQRVYFYKNLRSHLDSIRYTIHLPPATLHIGGGVGSQATLGVHPEPDVYDFRDTLYSSGQFGQNPTVGIPEKPDTFDFRHTLYPGGQFGPNTAVGVPEKPDTYDFQHTLYAGGRVLEQTVFPISEDTKPPDSTTILRTGTVCTILSNQGIEQS